MNLLVGGTVLEIVWIVLAAIGLVIWAVNVRSSLRTYRVISTLAGRGNGRLIYARFALTETILFVLIDALFIVLGLVSLRLADLPGSGNTESLIITIGALVCSGVITFLGYKWGRVDSAVIRSSSKRH